MIDQQAIHADMQRIFPSGTTGPAERSTGRPAGRALATMPPARRRRLGREGIAAAGFALAVTAIGLFAAPLLRTAPSAPARVAAIAPAGPVATMPAAAPVPSIAPPASVAPAPVVPMPPAATVTPAVPVAAPAPSPAAAAAPRPPVSRPSVSRPSASRAAGQRRLRADRTRRAQLRRRLGARSALQRAWARDRVLTRRLNQQALRRMQAG